jgi:hypothetical protein
VSAATGLARPATARQATFEPDEDEEEDEEPEEDDPLEAVSPAFLSLLLVLSPDDPAEEEESELAEESDFLPSDPLAEAAAGSELLRLSVR